MKKIGYKFKLIFSVFVIGIISPIFIVCAFYNPTTLNKFFVSKLYSEPVNNYFKDQNFYNCVIDSYNDEYDTNYIYSYNLSDEELISIKKLDCSGYNKSDNEKIVDTEGIEKLTELTYVDLSYNNINSIDLSENSLLETLKINNNPFLNRKTIYLNQKDIISIPITFSNNVITSLVSNNLDNIDLVENNISFDRSDLYNINFNFTHSIGTYNDFSVNMMYNVIRLQSDKYIIDEENSAIYYNDNFSKDDINIMLGNEEYIDELLTLDYSENKLIIKHDNEVIKTFDVKEIIVTSSAYSNIDNGYIYVGCNDIDLSKITTNIGTLNINNELNEIEVVYFDKVYKTIPIIKTNYSNYVVKDDNIYTFNEELDISKISVSNAEFEIDDNKLKLIYKEDIVLKIYNINNITLTFDEYIITDDSIYFKNDFSINDLDVKNATLNLNNSKLELIYNEEVIKEYNIIKIKITSDIYEIDNNYIYAYNINLNKDYIDTNIGEVFIDNDIVSIKYNDKLIDTYKIIYINSDKYKIGSDYIFTGVYALSLEDITSNASLSINENKVELRYNEELLKKFDISSINFGNLNVNNKIITIDNELSYEDFTNEISIIGATYKIEKSVIVDDDQIYQELTDGTITGGLLLRVYLGDDIIAYYSINQGYYDINSDSVEIDEINSYISNIKDKNTVEIIKKLIETTGEVTIFDKDENIKEDTDYIGTGDKLVIDLGHDRIFTYTLIVNGDINGDGEIDALDAFKIMRHSLGKETLKNEYFIAGDITLDDDLDALDAYRIIRYSLGKSINL